MMKSMRWKHIYKILGLAVLTAGLFSGCGRKKEEERLSVVITAAETVQAVTEAQTEEQKTDIVNGFHFERCDEMVYCTGEGVKLRKKPGMDGEVAGYMNRGRYVHRIGRNVKWSRLQIDGKRLYAATEYLSPYPPETEAPETEALPEGAEEEAE